MRLGLIGTGKQGQRYLLEKNGGRHIKVSGSRRIPLDDVDGVIIATHPAGHKELALEAIAAGKAVLIEKPLALNLADCMEIIDAAEKADVPFLVAHLDCWEMTAGGPYSPTCDVVCLVEYTKHDRDYSPWLDWGPHALAVLDCVGHLDPANVCLSQGKKNSLLVFSDAVVTYERGATARATTPMWGAVRSLQKRRKTYEHNRRVYRALFAEE